MKNQPNQEMSMNRLRTTLITTAATTAMVLAATLSGVAMANTKKPTSKAKAAAPAAAAAPVELTAEQVSIAQIVTTGRIQCADGQSVTITADAKVNGAFDVLFGKTKYDVVPKPTTSGAVRLEDSKTGIVFMQLANKSMLFNERQGRRLADDCISPAQQAVADGLKTNPSNGVLDGLNK
jgi:hypothetical protein